VKTVPGYFHLLHFGGAEARILGLNALITDPSMIDKMHLLLIDFQIAFNNVHMLRETIPHLSSLAPWILYTYFNPSMLFCGDLIILSSQGLPQQGDPLAIVTRHYGNFCRRG
jgi:hypothetical protein